MFTGIGVMIKVFVSDDLGGAGLVLMAVVLVLIWYVPREYFLKAGVGIFRWC